MKEVWKDIENYEGYYQVSNLGRVKSKTREVVYCNGNKHIYYGFELKQSLDTNGYKTVCLCKDNSPKTFKVHRLVAQAFIDNPNNYGYINHKDENKTNNHMNNLEWCDIRYNNTYGTRLERVAKKEGIPIIQLSIDGEYIGTFHSMSSAARAVGGNASPIRDALTGRSYISYDYCWCYVEEYEKYFRVD